jgi:hypothetical protein
MSGLQGADPYSPHDAWTTRRRRSSDGRTRCCFLDCCRLVPVADSVRESCEIPNASAQETASVRSLVRQAAPPLDPTCLLDIRALRLTFVPSGLVDRDWDSVLPRSPRGHDCLVAACALHRWCRCTRARAVAVWDTRLPVRGVRHRGGVSIRRPIRFRLACIGVPRRCSASAICSEERLASALLRSGVPQRHSASTVRSEERVASAKRSLGVPRLAQP